MENNMKTIKFVYWEDEEFWIGYLQDYPDYMTQGETLEELKENLKDIYKDITGGYIPGIRKVDELVVT
jgi:predicted RNase H-like HicB family nuclease